MEGTVAVVGLGASGEAAARLALEKGDSVYVSDLRTDASIAARAEWLRSLGAVVELGHHDSARIASADLVVVSPGIPPTAPVLQDLAGDGVRWISEPEFAFRFFKGPLIAVTGTNGKTTTAALTAHLLARSGIDAALGGNVGAGLAPPASELALRESAPDWYVLEMSSFQLAGTDRFRPEIGVVTTLSPDHLDRYDSLEEYYRDKARLFQNATPESRWVLNGDGKEVRELPGEAPGIRYYFSLEAQAGEASGEADRTSGGWLDGKELVLEGMDPGTGGKEVLLSVDRLSLLGRHNVANCLAAAVTARLAGATLEGIRTGLSDFPPLPHRMEPVGEWEGVLWVNDSKATNVEAARSALDSLDRPVVLLLGGKDKGEDFSALAESIRARARHVLLFGEARHRLEKALGPAVSARLIDGSFQDVISEARRSARPGDVVLLAPACSSFDMFRDYEDRGRRFAALARGDG